MIIRPFAIHIPDASLQDLRRRPRQVRWSASFNDEGWNDGASLSFMRRLCEHWLHRFDWRAQESRLNRFAHSMTTLDGTDIYFVHQPGNGPSPLPLVLTHGWPGSFIEMEHYHPHARRSWRARG